MLSLTHCLLNWRSLSKTLITLGTFLLWLLINSGCAPTSPSWMAAGNASPLMLPTTPHQSLPKPTLTIIPNSVIYALLPKLTVSTPTQPSSPPLPYLDFAVTHLPAANFFATLSHETQCNIIVDPSIHDRITLELHHVTLPEVLQALQNTYHYTWQKNSYGYQIRPISLQTHEFYLHTLALKRHSQSQMIVTSGEITPTTTDNPAHATQPGNTITTSTDNHFFTQLQAALDSLIQPESHENHTLQPHVTINAQTSTVLVRAYPDQLHQIANYLNHLNQSLTREVVICAKIIEVTLNTDFQSGVDWQLLNQQLQQQGNRAINRTTITALVPVFTLSTHWHQCISLLINLLMRQGQVKVLSSPRIATVNNQTAMIKVGEDQFYITGINSTTTNNSNTNPSLSQTIHFTPFFSGVALNVTPHINEDNTLTLHIHPLVSTVTEQIKTFTLSGENATLPLATSAIREADSIVQAKDNQVILIGGLMASDVRREKMTTPWLAKLPLLHYLFESQHRTTQKKEIIILLQPTLINPVLSNRPLPNPASLFTTTLSPKSPFPQHTLETLQQASMALHHHHPTQALQQLEQHQPLSLLHHVQYFMMLAALELQQQHSRRANTLYEQLQRGHPTNPIIEAGLAIARLQCGETQLARLPLAYALRSPSLPPVLYHYLSQHKPLLLL